MNDIQGLADAVVMTINNTPSNTKTLEYPPMSLDPEMNKKKYEIGRQAGGKIWCQ